MDMDEPAMVGDTRYTSERGSERTPVYVQFESKAFRRAVIIVLLLLVGLKIALYVYEALGSFLFLLLLAWLLSIAMEPAVAWFANRGMRRGMATGVVGLLLVVATVAFLAVFGSLFFTQVSELIKGLPDYVSQAATWVNNTFHTNLDPSKILDNLQITPAKVACTPDSSTSTQTIANQVTVKLGVGGATRST